MERNEVFIEGEFKGTEAAFGEAVNAVVVSNGEEVLIRCWLRSVKATVSELKPGTHVEFRAKFKSRRWSKGEKSGVQHEADAQSVRVIEGGKEHVEADDVPF